MKKITPQTKDITNENISKIAQLFPQVISEKKDEKGNVVKAIDFELLKQHLSDELVEGGDERYRLDWPGKRKSILKANTPITSTLKPDRESSVNFDTTENVYIEGDNFEVLKVLQESYLNKIKMIYIDPPYNTGKDFVYKDNFKVSKDDYEEEIGTEDEEGGKLFKNTDTNGRFHSDWLSMMYERLLVARDLLTDDGVIFMSIDDNEVHNLRKIADEVFGEENFVSEIAWRKSDNQANIGNIARVKEYIICFTKSIDKYSFGRLPLSEKAKKEYRYSDDKGQFRRSILLHKTRGRHFYKIETKSGNILDGPWMIKENDFEKLNKENGIYWTKGGEEQPYGKIYLHESKGQIPNDFWGIEFGTNQRGSEDVENLFNKRVFDFPKSTKMLSSIIKIGSNSKDIILDFFSGSASSSQAVMKLNAEDGGNRKFIMVQLPEETDESSEAFKAGYKHITEIGKERIRRAGKKIVEENAEKLKERETPLDIGFRVYKTSETIMKDIAKHPTELTQDMFVYMEDNIKENATPEDILTTVLLDYGLTLDQKIRSKNIAGSEVFMVNDTDLVACFNKDMDMEVVDAIAKMQPLRAVFRDACFKDDKDLINTVESKFKQLAPNTNVTVI